MNRRSSPDGKKIFYVEDKAVVSVTMDFGPPVQPGDPEIFLAKVKGVYDTIAFAGVGPDGNSILMLSTQKKTDVNPILILNWIEELKRRVPTGK